jgi:hypothetical protein
MRSAHDFHPLFVLVPLHGAKYGAYHGICGVSLTTPVDWSVTLIAYGARFHTVHPTHTSALALM